MPVPKNGSGLFRLFRDTPFPRIKLLAGGNPDERQHALTCLGDCDVLVVPGGLGDIVSSIEVLSKIAIPVVYIPGVEEYRGREMTSVAAAGREAARGTLVHVLEQGSVVLDGVRFLGTPLWSSPAHLHVDTARWFTQTATDLEPLQCADWWQDADNAAYASAICIANGWGVPKVTPRQTHFGMHPAVSIIENRRALQWLADKLADSFAGPTVVVTHFEPQLAESGDGNAPAQMNPGRGLLQRNQHAADVWLYGHAFENRDVVVEGVRVFGGHPVADFDLDVGDFMSAKLAERAAKKAKRGKLAIAARKSIPSPSIDLESGLVHPLSSVASRLLGQMQAAQKNVHTIVPHTMGQSRTLRQCVRRTIHAEMQSFKRAGNEAWRIERELYPASNNIEAVLMHARTNYEPPQGYPAKESDESAFDYYRMLDKMTSHVEWLGELPRRATQRLYRWAGGAYDVLRELESRNLEARAVAPLPKSLRLERFAQVVELRVKAKDFDFESIRAEVRKAFPFGDDWRFTIRVTSVDSFEESTERLLSVLQLRDVVTVINLAAVA